MLIIHRIDRDTKMRFCLSQCDSARLFIAGRLAGNFRLEDIPPFSRELFHTIPHQFPQRLFLAQLTHIPHCARNTLMNVSAQGGSGLRIVTSTLSSLIQSEVVQEITTS
ncbi:conserved hypothetical protein [Klebsiella grimontii]|jgi:hypothetical protein|uniref:Uncharacterized protein n=1 Tax=Klebsiella grimontii TaxID=2058152 RepID=A0A285B5G0_9ENTR|nr:conserved hypothetical protein [Klebsiella grimontii]